MKDWYRNYKILYHPWTLIACLYAVAWSVATIF
jgi:hypothetical protein